MSRSGPSAQGELTWTITFLSGEGDVPAMQPVTHDISGAGASLRVSTLANGIAPIGGNFSLVVSGVPGKVRRQCLYDTVDWAVSYYSKPAVCRTKTLARVLSPRTYESLLGRNLLYDKASVISQT